MSVTIGLGLLALMTAALAGYTMRFQETTSKVGQQLTGRYDVSLQDAITPGSQTARNLAWPILFVVLFLLVMTEFGWTWGLGIVALCFLVLTPVVQLFLPPPCHKHYLDVIVTALERRKSKFETRGDTLRVMAAADVLGRLRNVLQQESQKRPE